jgi:hypothetical protein
VIELRQVRHHQQELAQGEQPRFHMAHAEEQHRRGADRDGHPDAQAESAFGDHDPDVRRNAFVRTVDEPLLFTLLLAERFHHA